MSANDNSILTVPRAISASSDKELQRLMLLIQRRFNMKIHFFDIQFVKGKWYAWYEVKINQNVVNNGAS